jgi:hypothetical protein
LPDDLFSLVLTALAIAGAPAADAKTIETKRLSHITTLTLLPIQAYSQKQLSNVSVRLDELSRFVEAPIRAELDDLEKQFQRASAEMRQVYATLLRKRRLQRQLANDELQLTSLTEQAANVRASLSGLSDVDSATLAAKAEYEKAEELRQIWLSDIEQTTDAVDNAASELDTLPTETEIDDTSLPEAATLGAINISSARDPRRRHSLMISIMVGKIPSSCARIPCRAEAIPCSVVHGILLEAFEFARLSVWCPKAVSHWRSSSCMTSMAIRCASIEAGMPAYKVSNRKTSRISSMLTPFLIAPLMWTRSSGCRPMAASMATTVRLFIAIGSAGRLHISPYAWALMMSCRGSPNFPNAFIRFSTMSLPYIACRSFSPRSYSSRKFIIPLP